jgi:hypothetical protein
MQYLSLGKMNNTFIKQAVDIVTNAIECDKNGDLEEALKLYRRCPVPI